MQEPLCARWTATPAANYLLPMILTLNPMRRVAAVLAVELIVAALAILPGTFACGQTTTTSPALTILDPRGASSSTTRDAVHVLGRTSPDAKVTVGGESARVFSTGILVRDNVPLQMGGNRIAVVATAPN